MSNFSKIDDDEKYPLQSYSWQVISQTIAQKRLDKSAFLHNGTGIPVEIRKFFDIEGMNLDSKLLVHLDFNGKMFLANIEIVNEKNPRTRLIWGSDFSKEIQQLYSKWFSYFSNDGVYNESTPIIKFEKTSVPSQYKIEFIESKSDEDQDQIISQNIILKNLPIIKKFHYAQKAKPEYYYWVAFYRNRLNEYRSQFNGNFNLIIYGSPDNPLDFYSIPFSKINYCFDESKLRAEYKDAWILAIRNGIMTIWGGDENYKINVEEYFHNIQNIPQLSGLIDYIGLYEEIELKNACKKLKMEPLNIENFINSTSLDEVLKSSEHFIRNPEKIRVHEIINYCSKGEWVLPHFQRYFDWKKDDIRSFLEAIFHNYYVGSFLLWETDRDPEIGIQLIHGIDKNGELHPRSIILDGQQRITSIIYSTTSPNSDTFYQSQYWRNTAISKEHPVYFYIDFAQYLKNPKSTEIILSFNKKIETNICFNQFLFPFYELKRYSDWLSEFENYLESKSSDHKKIREIRNIIRKKLDSVYDKYEIPYISLPNTLDIDQVTDIFLGVNTKGKPLDVFDLLIARLYKYNIELKELWEKTNTNYPDINRYHKQVNKMPIYILQAISLYYDKTSSAKKADMLNIYKNIFENSSMKFEDEWDEFSRYTQNALEKLENLRDGFGVRNERDLPYSPIIPILAALLKVIDNKQNKAECYKKLEKWYWSSVFTQAYSSAVESQTSLDFKEMKEWFTDDSKIPTTILAMKREIDTLEFYSVKSESNTKYRGVLSLIALRSAQDFDTGLYLENSRNNDKDHIFPKSNKEFKDFKDINSVLNITWMSSDTNRKIKNAKRPSDYVKEFISQKYSGNEEKFIEILQSHFINQACYRYLLENDFFEFITEREKEIIIDIRKRLELQDSLKTTGLIAPNQPFTNKKIFSEAIKSCEKYIYWVDKYFSKPGLDILIESINYKKIKEIKILMSIDKVNENLRDSFKDFHNELKDKGISSSLNVITDPRTKSKFHDRWILSENVSYNIPSMDVIMRGQYSEIKLTDSKPPFDLWCKNSKDIVADWNEIKLILSKMDTAKESK